MTSHLRQTRLSIPKRWALLPVGMKRTRVFRGGRLWSLRSIRLLRRVPLPFGGLPFSVFRFPKCRWKTWGLLFAWKRVYLLAIDSITTSFGNHLGFVSVGKVSMSHCTISCSRVLKDVKLGIVFKLKYVKIYINNWAKGSYTKTNKAFG